LDVPEAAIVATVPEVRLLDPLAVDVRPVIAALAAHPLVIAHAPRQDLGLLYTRFAIALPNVVDTQLMAAFAGIGDQVGLATLAHEILGLSLAKEQQWTDWSKRPLSDAQLAYADADVRHLPALFARLRTRLGDRLPWVRAESTEVAADAVAAASVTAETAWRQLGGLRGMDAKSLAAAIDLAAWRLRVALELDRPLGQVLNEKVLIDLARHRPQNAAAVRTIKGLSPLAKQRAEELADLISAADPAAAKDLISESRSSGTSARAQRWAEMLLAIVQLVADRTGVAPRLLATRSDAEELARLVDEGGLAAAETHPALTTWRRPVIGQPWLDWLSGKAALTGDLEAHGGLKLT
jgi:ribonuclease D